MVASTIPIGDLLPDEGIIYRAVEYPEQIGKDGRIKVRVFFLKPAHGEYEDETYLSFGVNPEGAAAGLTNVHAICELSVGAIHSLGRKIGLRLEVRTDVEDPRKVRLYGLPLKAQDEDGARRAATELASMAKLTGSVRF